MGFIRQQEERLTIRYLQWQYQRLGQVPPSMAELQTKAARIVDEAHRIAKERGRNVMAIIKEMVEEFFRKP